MMALASSAQLSARRFLVRGGSEPAVEVVEDRFHRWPQFVGDLVLALALAGAASGFGEASTSSYSAIRRQTEHGVGVTLSNWQVAGLCAGTA
jgi:hypothetical protein